MAVIRAGINQPQIAVHQCSVISAQCQVFPLSDRFRESGIGMGAGDGKNQPVYTFRVIGSKMLGNHAAHGDPENMGFRDAQEIHGFFKVAGHIPGGSTAGEHGFPAESVNGKILGEHPVHQRHGQGSAFGGAKPVSQAGKHNEKFRPAAEADIVHGSIIHSQCAVFGMQHIYHLFYTIA